MLEELMIYKNTFFLHNSSLHMLCAPTPLSPIDTEHSYTYHSLVVNLNHFIPSMDFLAPICR